MLLEQVPGDLPEVAGRATGLGGGAGFGGEGGRSFYYRTAKDIVEPPGIGNRGMPVEESIDLHGQAGLAARDRLVLEMGAAARLPVAIVMAGGYARDIQDTVDIHCQTVRLAAEMASPTADSQAAAQHPRR